MSRVVAGTLLLPNGLPMANASIYFTAKRTEPVSIIEGSNTFFNTSAAGVYNQSVVNGFYAVSIEYIADASGAHTRRWQLGDVFIEDGATTTLEALIIASNVPDDIALGVFYQILEEAQAAAASAAASAEAAAASAASISIGTGPTQIPTNTILNVRLGTAENLGTAAQQNSTAFATAAQGTKADSAIQTTDLNTRLGTAGNLGSMAQQASNAVAVTGGAVAGLTSLGVAGNVTFAGAARRILGDFSAATVANRASVQTSVVNGATAFGLLPNGTSTFSALTCYASSDPTNASAAGVGINGAAAFVESGRAGSGSFLPLAFYTNGIQQEVITAAGNHGMGVSNPVAHKLEVSGRAYASGGFVFPTFLKTTVPSAASNANAGIIVTDAAGAGRRPFWSDGTNWRDAANVILS